MSIIPAVDLTRQNKIIATELGDSLNALIEEGHFILGLRVRELEEKLANHHGVGFGVGVASGSDALFLGLQALGIGPGDEVITTALSFYATAAAVVRAGARPVFIDVEPRTMNLDPLQLEKSLTSKTKAIIPVHLFGCPAAMDKITAFSRTHNLFVIEDVAQAIGGSLHGKPLGSWGDAGCFSFFPTKNLGAFGDGGMVITNRPDLADLLRILRANGAKEKYDHVLLGYNSRLDELQAAILLAKLPYLEGWLERRRSIAARYTAVISQEATAWDVKISLPQEPPGARHVYHQYTLATPFRNELQDYLKSREIQTTIYYPIPLHLQTVFRPLGYRRGDLPITEELCQRVISLPMFPELEEKEIDYVLECVVDFYKNCRWEK